MATMKDNAPPHGTPRLRPAPLIFGGLLLIGSWQVACADARQSGIAKRIPWTTSRTTGSSEPPLPFVSERAFPGIKFEQCLDLTGQLALLDVYAVLKRARLFIGNDSGLMHLAAAAGCPTVGLFGPSDDRLYAPWGLQSRVVRGPRTFEQFKEVDPGLNQTIGHMLDLKVEPVLEAATELLAATA